MLTTILAPADRILFVDVSCGMHNAQLVVKNGLGIVDSWAREQNLGWRGYYASCAKLIHIWREKARNIYEAWCDQFGALSPRQRALKMPARCIAGRWGSIMETEGDLLSAGCAC
ncbi:MAG: hypothetical protein ACKPKO_63095, partial [Candidatus Fonsibacter sp.]